MSRSGARASSGNRWRAAFDWAFRSSIVIAALLWFFWGRIGPAPPIPDGLDELDPKVATLVRQGAKQVSWNRRDRDAWMQLGMVYEANGLQNEADRCYRRVVALRDSDAPAWFRLAMLRAAEGDLATASALMEKALEHDERYAPAHWRLGLWQMDLGQLEEAERSLRRATALSPVDPAAWFGLARLHLQQRRPDDAIEIIEAQRLKDTNNRRYAFQLLSSAYRQQGRFEDAEQAATVAGTRGPVFTDQWTDRMLGYQTGYPAMKEVVTDYIRAGQFHKATPLLEELCSYDPNDLGSLNNLAICCLETGQADRCVETLEQALAIDPDDYMTNSNMALALVRMSDADRAGLQRALAHVDAAIETRPRSARAWFIRGSILADMQRPDEAAEAFQSAYECDARDASSLVRAVRLKLDIGAIDDAEAIIAQLADHPSVTTHDVQELTRRLNHLRDAQRRKDPDG